jgi:hypothetical protein
MKKQDIFWIAGLLVTLSVSALFPAKVLATQPEKVDNFFSVNTNDHTDEIYYNTSDQHSNINNINNFSLYKSNYSYSLGNEILTAQETNNQQQTQFTPIQPNLPVVPKEIPSLPIPEDKPETNTNISTRTK